MQYNFQATRWLAHQKDQVPLRRWTNRKSTSEQPDHVWARQAGFPRYAHNNDGASFGIGSKQFSMIAASTAAWIAAFRMNRMRCMEPHSACRSSSSSSSSSSSNKGANGVAVTDRSAEITSNWKRFKQAMPCGDDMDRQIATVGLPSVANLLIIPLVSAIDTYWVGRMGESLPLAGMGAANQVFSYLFWVIAFLPSVTTPLVARAAASKDEAEARNRVCEAAFLALTMGLFGASCLFFATQFVLRIVLPPGAPAIAYAGPYLRIRALSFVPALFSTVGFAAFRGMRDTVTPLRVALFANMLNMIMDPILMFGLGMGTVGAAAATVIAEITAGITYLVLLCRCRLITKDSLLKVPSMARLAPLLKGGAAVQLRSLALNTAFVFATRQAQAMDSAGVMAAAYTISLQLWQLGGVAFFALQGCACVLVPAESARDGPKAAQKMADRLMGIALIMGVVIGILQLLLLPSLSTFLPVPAVRRAVVTPIVVASLMSIFTGVVFAGEGIMMGRGAWGRLAMQAAVSGVVMVICLQISRQMQGGLVGVWLSIGTFNLVNLAGVLWHHFFVSPRQEKLAKNSQN